jgi:hypothetical protein
MTQWTSELEDNIRKLGESTERNTLDGANPDMPLAVSLLRIAFRSATQSEPLYKKICSEMNLDSKNKYTDNIQKIVDFAVENSSDAGEKLQKQVDFVRELNKTIPRTQPIARMKAVRSGEISYPVLEQ